MDHCKDFIKTEFPSIDIEMFQYIEGVLQNGIEDFHDSEDIFEAIGEVLQEIANKSESDIRGICSKLLHFMRPHSNDNVIRNGHTKILDAPVHLASMAADLEDNDMEIKSIWVNSRDDSLKVDKKKLEKAQAKLQQKQDKRTEQVVKGVGTMSVINSKMDAATASQVTSKKEAKLEAKGNNRATDIRIENFDVAYGERILLQNTDVTLACGRRYGLVGRNGLGKTTLLRMISGGQLRIPSHISILHVEQEVVGDDTPALESVLECDFVRHGLLTREKEINTLIADGSTASAELSSELSEIYMQLSAIEADKAPARASVILDGLGFNPDMQKKATKHFSGGWRMRLALARALFSKPDLLLLDEPTNMLDMKAIIWLENYLQTWQSTLLVVSHDRHFLDTVPTDILHLHSQRIDTYRGNYEIFEKTKNEKLKNQQREIEAQMAHRAHVQEFIDRFRYNANRASSVQSKIKMLEKLPELKPIEKEVEVVLRFPETEGLSPPILQLDDISFAYPGCNNVLQNVNLGATLESRICIVGDNGAGKTTLLKIIMGILNTTAGVRNVHRSLKFGYFSQHHVDQLEMNLSSVELLQSSFPGKTVEEYRRQLGGFGISGDLALQSVGSLSGGQKSRVAFARMCMSNPNFLVLDEPTNHLDIETIEALGKAIQKYTGGLILVSHDERLIRMVCKELWVCGGGSVKSIEGGFNEYRTIVERELAEAAK
ncbi:ATP-binding cassette sub-family F member 3 [Acyrthosiphon pisum]|uniref:ATP-binding cassette sub-family F member 3 n=1 Tax=Acyrthosiphon pisum TaxID=7029 RepID=A0A8R2A6N9_ACYPI|nr:ATP-binding cassette sub-family F member 3 [Acyrthosiphon pisum]|eukprot:XP_001946527.2 PREDICTED: ATP-binding cassette sub-family F member 3 [Acyrthosiphon pisum]